MVVALAFLASTADAAYMHSGLLKMGMTSSNVMSLQQTLNGNGFLVSTVGAGSPGMESMYFGAKTKAAVMAFQSAKGLTTDGIVGAQSGAALAAMTGGSMSYPAGCMSTSGFSTTTGMPCTSTGNTSAGSLPAGCMSTAGFSPTTGMRCSESLPAGCMSTAGFSPTTGMGCSGGSTPSMSGPLQGGAGDAIITQTSVDVESEVKEGTTEKVLGFRVEAQDSDVQITNVRVMVQNDDTANSSKRPERYLSAIEIWQDGTRVGTIDPADMTKDGNDYSKSVALRNAVVREGSGNRTNFYVGFKALSNIDTADMNTANWGAEISQVRFTDGTGVVLTSATNVSNIAGGTNNNPITFTDLASSGDVKVKVTKGSNNPVAGNMKVSDTGTTNDVTLLEFRLKAEGTDVTFDTLDVDVTGTGATPALIASELKLMSGSRTIADLTGLGTNGVKTFDLYDDFTIDAEDTETFKVVARIRTIAAGSGNAGVFDQGDSMLVSYDNVTAEDENGDNVTNITGSAVGETQAFYSEGVNVSNFTSSSAAISDQNGAITKQTFTVSYDVTAFGQTYYIPKTIARAATATAADNGLAYLVETSANTVATTVNAAAAQSSLSSTANTVAGMFEIPDGETKRFTATIELTAGTGPTPGFYRIQLSQVGYDINTTVGGTLGSNFTPAQNYETADRKID